jgi:outer membrane murein-binding lipoprotein Lpp
VTQGCSSKEEEKVKQLIKKIQQLEAEVARLQAKLIGMWGDA